MLRKSAENIRKFDAELVEIVQDFLLLTPLSWPKETMRAFLKRAAKGKMKLPQVEYPQADYREKIEQLTRYIRKLGTDDHPAVAFLRETAESYLDAYRILQGTGTRDVSEFSRKLYGSPRDYLPGYKRRHIDVARYFLRVVEDYKFTVVDEPRIYTSGQFRNILTKRVGKVIGAGQDSIAITLDSTLSARATAGPNYVKIRKSARFSQNDLDQLFHHEVMTHTLTYLNGRRQPLLKTLGYSAPRATATQEGLAVFSEYINLSIELVRLQRIALRILAIDMAEQGADFIDLFRFYQKHGQDAEESYYSAMRIFRGGRPQGGIVFYKDNVYLRGVVEVNSFLKHVMHQGMIHDIALLFCGKLTTQDVFRLQSLSEAGYIADPAYLPDWARRSGELAAHLALNDLTERFKLKEES